MGCSDEALFEADIGCEDLKIEVIKSIVRALESKLINGAVVYDFDEKDGADFYQEVTKFEIELIKRALAHTAGNQRAAARLLGMKVTTLHGKIKSYGINTSSVAA